MKAFISYSHQDRQMLEMLHKHLTLLQREKIIDTWTDRQILAGETFENNINAVLNSSHLFIALLSPDYLASNYCYETEFTRALELHEQGRILIVPIILESCDWLNSPFSKFLALPQDGKPISTWENKNTAFLDVIQHIRRLIESRIANKSITGQQRPSEITLSRNYRIQKDFDSIEKIEFVEKSFHEIKTYIQRYLDEVVQLENIKSRTLVADEKAFKCILVNRNKIATEAELNISIDSQNPNFGFFQSSERQIEYSITQSNRRSSQKSFTLSFDEYHLFWAPLNISFGNSANRKGLGSKEIADIIWGELLESVGIL